MLKYANFIQDLLNTHQELEKMSKVVLNEQCLAVVMEGIPPKMGDPQCLTFPCKFGNATKTYAMADSGASINMMPYLFDQKLNLPKLKSTRMAMNMANRSVTYPRGIVEYLLVKIGKFVFPIDFVVSDMKEDEDGPIILGLPLLNTTRALVDICNSKLRLRVGDEEITFGVNKKITPSKASNEVFLWTK
ncbi:hypothetical protein Lser_V15G24233 [Lactuca serriola]